MKDLSKCPICGTVLVSHEEVHAVNGQVFCSRTCAITDIMNDIILNAKEMAIETYDNEAEVVASADVLKEDLQDVKITLTCTKVIKLPRNLPEAAAIAEATLLYNEGLLDMDPCECDNVDIKCELVKDNSAQEVE